MLFDSPSRTWRWWLLCRPGAAWINKCAATPAGMSLVGFFAVRSGKLRFAVINLLRASLTPQLHQTFLAQLARHRSCFATVTRETTGCLPERAGGRRVCVWTCHSELSDVDVSRSGMTAALYEGGMARNPDMVCVCVCARWTALADVRWRGCHAPRTLSHTHKHKHPYPTTASMNGHSAPASSMKTSQRRGRGGGKGGGWRMESRAKRNMVGSSVLLPVLMSTPGKYSVNESIFLGGYTSHFTPQRRRWRRGDSPMMSWVVRWTFLNESQCVLEDVIFGLPLGLVLL